jgi:hypothetical protein
MKMIGRRKDSKHISKVKLIPLLDHFETGEDNEEIQNSCKYTGTHQHRRRRNRLDNLSTITFIAYFIRYGAKKVWCPY